MKLMIQRLGEIMQLVIGSGDVERNETKFGINNAAERGDIEERN